MEDQLERIDLRGLRCPEPVMMLHIHFRRLTSGEQVWVITTDPTTCRDVPKFCHFLGHTLLEQRSVSELPEAWQCDECDDRGVRDEFVTSAETVADTVPAQYYLFLIQKN
ncbi:MAG: sulfurtransferase TusA [Gammaproteobacteria bacterium]